MTSFRCATCDELHDISEMTLGADAPAHWNEALHGDSPDCELTGEQCVIDQENFFIRGCLDIPILDTEEVFRWGVWTTLSEGNFLEITDNWDKRSRTRLGPHFGWLSTTIPGYPDTLNLRCHVHHHPPGIRPTIELLDSEHLLCVHFHNGVPIDFLMPILHPYLANKQTSANKTS